MEPRSHSVLRHKIKEEIESRTIHIVSGSMMDYAQYQNSAGYIQGLEVALKLLDETNTEISGG